MTHGYSKLFSDLVTSSLWTQGDKNVKIVWITLLAMASRDGVVEHSLPGIAKMADVTLAECEAAFEYLSAPDQYSRTPDNEGRRIRKVANGWFIINYAKHQNRMTLEARKAYKAKWAKDKRAGDSGFQVVKPAKQGWKKPAGGGGSLPGEGAYLQAERNGATEAELGEIAAANLPDKRT